MTFAAATAVTPDGPGRFAAEIHAGWDIAADATGPITNGGYLLGIAGRALAAATDRPDPITLTAHYLAPGRPGPAVVETEVVKAGKRLDPVRGTLLGPDGKAVLSLLGAFGDVTVGDVPTAVTYLNVEPPELPPVEDLLALPRIQPTSAPTVGLADKMIVRLHPEDLGFATGNPSGIPRSRGWFALPDDEPIDTIGLLFVVDAFAPPIFSMGILGWAPTLELTAHIRARPVPGWLRCHFECSVISAGLMQSDGLIWDAAGNVVAQSRQIALMPRT